MGNELQTIKLSELPEAITLNESDYSLIVQNGTSKKIKGLLLKGNGKSIEIQKTDTHIQWRQEGGQWINLVALADLKGDKGDKGDKGEAGVNGRDGADAIDPTFTIGTVTTLPSGSNATVTLTGTYPNLVLNFGIPKGADGSGGGTGEGLTSEQAQQLQTAYEHSQTPHVQPVYSILKDKKWVVIGDSISDTVDGRTRTDKFYQEFIAENTGCTLVNWNGNGTGYKTEFNGKSYIYNRLDEIPSDANLITIFSGTNDNITLGNYGDTGFNTFYGVVDETVKAIKDKFPLVPLGLITPLPRTSSDLSNTKNKGYSEAIKAIGKKYSVPVLDLYADCGFHVNNNEFKLNCLPDGLHPNINGHAMLSKKIQPWLENVVLTDEYTKYVIRGMGILSASSLGFTSGGTKEFTIALDRVPNENQGIVLQSTNTSVTISPSTIYFNKTAEAKTITLTIPSSVTASFTINAVSWNTNIGSITFSNNGSSSGGGGGESEVTLSSITAEYTQGSTAVYPTTNLDSLKNNLVVKANYSDSSQTTLSSTDYSLSGTLTVGTSTITVTYSGKTTTFIVNVTEEQQEDISNLEYYVNLDFTNSLNSTSSIANLANSSKNGSIESNSSPTWGDGYLSITDGGGITVPDLELTGILEFSYELDCELTNSSLTPTLAYLYGQKGDNNFIFYEQSKVKASPRAYDDGANTYITNISGNVDKSIRNKITVTYKPSEIKLYVNGNLLATATDTTSNYSIKHILVCSSSFTGKIYGFKVYKKCLTNSEVVSGSYVTDESKNRLMAEDGSYLIIN